MSGLDERGCRARAVSIRRLDDLREGIDRHREMGSLDEAFYLKALAWFEFGPPGNLADARSIIVTAVAQPQVRFAFAWQGRRISTVVPPTYLHAREADRRVQELLTERLAPMGYRVAPARVPRKLLAVRSGLAAYGRNNITYVEGFGSFHRLAAFYSDLPCEQDEWLKPRMLDRCEECRACTVHCPSGAIGPDRFLLHAERCISYHNEEPGEVPFPEWMDPAWADSLVGCMRCQKVCPENKESWGWIVEGVEFSEDETALLLEGRPLERLPEETAAKLTEHDLVDVIDLLPRNLRVLFDGRRCAPGMHMTSAEW